MLKKLFEMQRVELNYFFDALDEVKARTFFEACAACSGLLVFTGVGKSGLVAEKIAATLSSTGTRALYIPTINFIHGDLGILSSQDVLILLSKSGETEELLSLVPFAKRKGAKLLSLTCRDKSRLAASCDVNVTLPMRRELCPFDLVPTTSTAMQLLFGDVLAVALMQAKGFTLDAYAENHPAGSIGKKLLLTVEDIMRTDLPLCYKDDMLMDVLVELSDKRCGCLLVVDEVSKLLGIFTDGDLRRAIQRERESILQLRMEDLMCMEPITVSPDMSAWDAMKRMQKDPKRWILTAPVVRDERVVGIIRMHDLVQAGLV